ENIDKLNDFTFKFNDIQENISVLKDKIETEIEEKIRKERENIDLFLVERNSLLEKENNVVEERIRSKFNEYYDELEKVKGVVEDNKNQFETLFDKKTSDVNEKFILLVDELKNNVKSIEEDIRSKNSEIIDKNIDYLKSAEAKFLDIEKEISVVKSNLDNEISSKIANGSRVMTENFENMNNLVLEKINLYKNELTSLQSEIKSIDLKYEEDLAKKVKGIEDRVGRSIDEINDRYKSNLDTLFERMNVVKADYENNFADIEAKLIEKNEKIYNENYQRFLNFENNFNILKEGIESLKSKIEDDVTEKINEGRLRFDETLEYENARIREKFNDFNKDFSDKVDFYNEQFVNLKLNLEKIGENYDLVLDEKLNNIDLKISNFYNDKSVQFKQRIGEMASSIDTVQREFEEKLSVIKKDFDGKNGEILNQSREYLESIVNRFNGITKDIEDMKRDFDVEITEKMKISDEKISNFENELNSRFEERYNNLVNKINDNEKDFIRRNEEVINNNRASLEEMVSSFNLLSNEIKELKNNIDSDISFKIASGKDDIDSLFNSGSARLKDNYRELENETVKKINDYRNEIFRIKQNIAGLDEKFNLIFDEKVDRFENVLSENINGLNVKYQSDIGLLEKKLFDIETELRMSVTNIEKNYLTRAEEMLSKNAEKLNGFVGKFEELNITATALKESIEGDVSEKVKTCKDEIKIILENEIETARNTFKVTRDDFERKTDEFKKETLRISQNIKTIDDKFTARFLEHSNILDKKILNLEETVKNVEKQASIFDKANSLKDKLNSDIKTLKDEIANIKASREEIIEVERKMVDIKNIFAKTEEKSTLIIADRKKIDNISSVVSELKQVTANVEEKIENVKSAKVMLTNIEDKIELVNKKFADLGEYLNLLGGKENEVRQSLEYAESLKGKTEDLNQKFDVLNKKFDDLDFKKSTFEKSLKNFEKDASVITKSEAKIGDVMDKFNQMDSLIDDLEERTESINRIREWLVRAETQIENMNYETDKRIRLLESLISKTGESPIITERMKSETSKKETVLLLQSQGWTIDDIAKTLGLSLGEVDFILDMELSKKR
nr:hypothetical protein [Spirochaetota bacterium]